MTLQEFRDGAWQGFCCYVKGLPKRLFSRVIGPKVMNSSWELPLLERTGWNGG